ncbi:glycosyltransferase [Commensalibacter papalotli (ex Servin-Garciduenas et al. 2014)]|uniref:Glycosyl transferase family protein n=1 Tax=Commensalibacter papalotli (ex Servin-Garciduenas et al. 2014) TaxID=1208583 RepID=W7E3D4_9PROT|nr:glycosyltransferase [Commensalibacter papalotli (ex Servin-Garciduenas et al. 2014)]EUK17586.1 glycosyl transferase family protein [Commensalibacter papalotli (ex Servin-Garciduenas et al. 2014)]
MTKKIKKNLSESYSNSLKLSSLKISNLQSEISNLKGEVSNLQSKISNIQSEIKEKETLIQRIKTPLYCKVTLLNGMVSYFVKGQFFKEYPIKIVKKRLFEVYKEEGYRGIYRKLILRFPKLRAIFQKFESTKKQSEHSQHNVVPAQNTFIDNIDLIYNYQFPNNKSNSQYPLILIIAEVTLPQCYKYRVQQKVEHLERLGWIVKVSDWRTQKQVMSLLQISQEVIFYRVPAFPNVLEQLQEAKRLGLKPWWEVDDLIINQERYAECGFMQYLSTEEKNLLFFGTGLYRKTMFSCEHAIASTQALAKVMQQEGVPEVYVIENALDQNTLNIAERLNRSKVNKTIKEKNSDEVTIVYGSGSNTHNADFLAASMGILSALKNEKRLRLSIVGELDLPIEFQDVINQITYTPPQSYERYLELLAQGDIAIAPLEPILFNDAKSNIKYLEASILGVPSVCSPRQAFSDVITDSENGFLANTSDEWKEKLLLLARDKELRCSMAQQAYQSVISRYSPKVITDQQVQPVFGLPAKQVVKKNSLKILVVNVYYDPYSFGGATFVAEEMARRIHQHEDVEVTIFTSRPVKGQERGLCKYKNHGSIVYSVDIPSAIHASQQFDNVEIIEPFEMVLDAVKPDIVHFHSIQNMGLQMLFSCQSKQIPYVITLHDSWWLCNRQFMTRSNGNYCFQTKIDLRVCQTCEAHADYIPLRSMMMKQGLQAASLLLSPSETHRQLYIANDIDEASIKVNRNGIVRPKKKRPSRPTNTPLRFGFVAGDEAIKGAQVIQKAFKSLRRSDWELKIIDSKINMGFAPIDVSNWGVEGKVVTIPPYDVQGKDDFFYGIDVLLFPSQWKESYGMTVREALLRDVWVICSNPGGQSEDVVDGVNGTYVSLTGDSEELKRVIEDLLDKASMFDNYVNTHKDHIATMEEQTEELLGYYYQIKEETQQLSLT